MPAYKDCPDDGIVAYDWEQHLLFHGRLAEQVDTLVALTQQVGALTQQVGVLTARVTELETTTEEPT